MFHTKSRKILLRDSDLNRMIHKLTHADFEQGDLKLPFPFKLKYELNLSCKFILRGVRKIAKCTCQLLHVCLCVHLSVHHPAPTERIFMKFDIWAFFAKYVKKIQV